MASWLSLAEPCQFHSSQLVSSNPLLFLLFEWFRRVFLCHMHPSPPTPNKEHAGWEQSTDELSRGSLHWGWGQVNSSRNSYIHNYKLMTMQKKKFKREPQILYSCSLVNWTAGGSPNDLQFNLNYVISFCAQKIRAEGWGVHRERLAEWQEACPVCIRQCVSLSQLSL